MRLKIHRVFPFWTHEHYIVDADRNIVGECWTAISASSLEAFNKNKRLTNHRLTILMLKGDETAVVKKIPYARVRQDGVYEKQLQDAHGVFVTLQAKNLVNKLNVPAVRELYNKALEKDGIVIKFKRSE